MSKEENMIKTQKKMSAEKVAYAKDIVDSMIKKGEAVTPYSVWKKSHLSKAFIYSNEEVKKYIEAHRSEKKYNYRSYDKRDVLEEKITYLERENSLLRKDLQIFRDSTIEYLANENQLLRHRLQKYEELLREKGVIE